MDWMAELQQQAGRIRQAVAGSGWPELLYAKIKLVYGCNLGCVMCRHWRTTRPTQLPTGRVLTLLGELASLGCRKIHFSGGEPLLREDLVDIVQETTRLGMRATLTTNGSLVGKATARGLVEAGLRGVNVCIDSPRRKVHDGIRSVEGAWKKASQAVRHFRRQAGRGRLSIRVNTVVSRLNYLSLDGMPDFAASLGADALNLIGVDDHWDGQLRLHRREVEAFNTRLAPEIARRSLELGLMADEAQAYPFGRSAEDGRLARKGDYGLGWYRSHPCYVPWFHCLIDDSGLVYLCCMTRESTPPLGNVNLQAMDAIWQGEVYRSVRQRMTPPGLRQCQRCDDFLNENRRLYQLLEKGETLTEI